MAQTKTTPQTLLWLDLEMTGLDPAKDVILEVAAIVTDWNFTELASFESGVQQNREIADALLAINPFAMSRPTETQQLLDVSLAGLPEKTAEDRLIELVDKYCPRDEVALLAGNSIHTDRQFIRVYWPNLERRLHYRMLDVSAWKVVMQAKHNLEFTKKETHRALDDIRESIAELEYYLQYIKVEK